MNSCRVGIPPEMKNSRIILMLAVMVCLLESGYAESYGYASGQLVAKLDGELEFYHLDSLGSTRAMTDELGMVIEEQKTLPFGGVLEGDEKYGFTGKELDESDLQYFGSRYYDSGTGRFISTDPAMQYLSPYIYAGNNPLAYKDSDGNMAHSVAAPFFVPLGPWGWAALGLMTATSALMTYQAIQNPIGNIETFPAIEFPSSWNEIFPAEAPTGIQTETFPAGAPTGMWTETFPAAADALFWQEQFIPPTMPDMSVMIAESADLTENQRDMIGKVKQITSEFKAGDCEDCAGRVANFLTFTRETKVGSYIGSIEWRTYKFREEFNEGRSALLSKHYVIVAEIDGEEILFDRTGFARYFGSPINGIVNPDFAHINVGFFGRLSDAPEGYEESSYKSLKF